MATDIQPLDLLRKLRDECPSPPLFKGRSDAGTTVEIVPVADGYDVFEDGARIDHGAVPWHLDPQLHGRLQVAGKMFDETFDAPPDAVLELAAFLDGGAGPPWRLGARADRGWARRCRARADAARSPLLRSPPCRGDATSSGS